jgi:hypothetical protein
MIDLSSDFRPVPKPMRPKKRETRRKNSTLKSRARVVPEAVKKEALKKSDLCFAGFCPVCGGRRVTAKDDPHHFPHRSQGGKDIADHIWMSKRLCHSYIHEYPDVEREMFRKVEVAGYKVVWKVEGKKVRYVDE